MTSTSVIFVCESPPQDHSGCLKHHRYPFTYKFPPLTSSLHQAGHLYTINRAVRVCKSTLNPYAVNFTLDFPTFFSEMFNSASMNDSMFIYQNYSGTPLWFGFSKKRTLPYGLIIMYNHFIVARREAQSVIFPF